MDVHALIAEITERNTGTLDSDTLLTELDNWDSLKGVRLVLRIEEVMGRELLEEEIGGLESIGDVERLLQPDT